MDAQPLGSRQVDAPTVSSAVRENGQPASLPGYFGRKFGLVAEGFGSLSGCFWVPNPSAEGL